MGDLLLALDQGTTSSRAIVFELDGRPLSVAQRAFPQSFPRPGWVEHDPEDIWGSQVEAAREALVRAGISASDLAAIGIANQRETAVVWDRRTGQAIVPAIVWQDRRTADECARLRAVGTEERVRERTGLLLDPYFSATKITAILNAVPGARSAAARGRLAFGTVDTFLLWRLTGGRVHATDVSNASRTLLMDASRCAWDDDMLSLFRVPKPILPDILPSAHMFGETEPDVLGARVPICALVGDQQAAAFGQACTRSGMVKNTYGTGSFVMMNTGTERCASAHRLLSTVAWKLGDEPTSYALEGSVFVTGAAVQWLRDGLGIIADAADIEALAGTVPDSGGVTFVPAFVGLGAPHWEPGVRGAILGLTRGASRAHIARATLEAACFQTRDVLEALGQDAARPAETIRADGGMAANDLFLQMQADLAGIPVERPRVTETTALGAALMAGIGSGRLSGADEAERCWTRDCVFEPMISADERDARYAAWKSAVAMLCRDVHIANNDEER